ncbi:MAG: hypothetical protein LBS85_01000 [Clostridiales Family XIII bacterium]|jgi:hypothetical protein|nr:hypothetical protein [Clostridiales Family XIII bacterium]
MSKLAKYMNDPDIAKEPSALREVHAIRLMIRDETKGMTPEQRTALTNKRANDVMEKYGLSHLRVV